MKTLILCIALAATAVSGESMQPSPAEATLRTVIADQSAAWNRGDSTAWVAAFTADAGFINIRGDIVHGRPGIEALHRMILAGPFKGSHNQVSVESILFPAADVAIIETTHEVTHYTSLPPGVVATEPGVLRTHMKYIAVKKDGAWQLMAAQNTAILPTPPGGPFVPPQIR